MKLSACVDMLWFLRRYLTIINRGISKYLLFTEHFVPYVHRVLYEVG